MNIEQIYLDDGALIKVQFSRDKYKLENIEFVVSTSN